MNPTFSRLNILACKVLFAGLFFCAPVIQANQELVISQAPLLGPGDRRNDWNSMLLHLALEKTLDDYGPYRIDHVPQMSRARLWKSAQTNRYPNLMFAIAYATKHMEKDDITYIPFPVELGFLSYRVCFQPKSHAQKINRAIATEDFKALTHGVQREWEDADILSANGYTVVKIEEYKSLFAMTAAGRFDLLCRGAAEIYDEYSRHSDIENLGLEKKISFHYQIPVFYFTNRHNKKAIERVHTGLVRARNDGSMITLFEAHYQERINFANLGQRQLIELDNPLIEDLDKDYQQYNYIP